MTSIYNPVYDSANFTESFQVVDEIKCFESRDNYYDCLDKLNDEIDNKFKCPAQYKNWLKSCPASYRKVHAFERQVEKENKFLYTHQQLKEYNAQKNKSYEFSRYPSNSTY